MFRSFFAQRAASFQEKERLKVNKKKMKSLGLEAGPDIGKLTSGLSIKIKGKIISPEELTKKEFFIAIIKGFLEDEPNLKEFIKGYRKSKGYAMWKEEVLDKEIEEGGKDMEGFAPLEAACTLSSPSWLCRSSLISMRKK